MVLSPPKRGDHSANRVRQVTAVISKLKHESPKPRTLPDMKTAKRGKNPNTAKAGARSRSQRTTTADVLGRRPRAAQSPDAVPQKWHWHYRVLLALQNRLLRERGELLGAAAEPLEPHSLSEADSATDESDHDLALSQLSAEQDALYEVNEALRRILAGTYGVCEETGAVIPAARLKAIPWARFTRQVEERLEKNGVVRRAHLGRSATVRKRGQVWMEPEEVAEEMEETPPAPPKDEALSYVFTPPAEPPALSQHKDSQPGPRTPKGKGRTK